MPGRTKYLLAGAVAVGAAWAQVLKPAQARLEKSGLKFRVLPPALKKSRALDIDERPLTFSRDGRTLACSVYTHNRVSRKDDGSIMLRDVRSGRVLKSLPQPRVSGHAATLSGAAMWVGSGGQFTGSIVTRSTSRPKWRVLARGYGIYDKQGYSRGFRGLDPVGALAASPDGRKLLVGIFGDGEMSSWGKVLLMDARTGRVTRNLPGSYPGPAVDAVAFSPDGRTVAWGDLEGGVRLCSTRAGTRTRRLRSGNPNGPPVTAVAFRGRDELVSVDEKGSIRFWNARTGRLKRTLKESELSKWNVTRLVLSPNGHALAVSYQGGFMRLYAIP